MFTSMSSASTEKNSGLMTNLASWFKAWTYWIFPLTGLLSHLLQDHWVDFFKNFIRMFFSMSGYASTKNNYSPSTNLATIDHFGFFLLSHLRNHWSDLNETWLFTSMSSYASTEKNLVCWQIWPFGSHLVNFAIDMSPPRPLGGLFFENVLVWMYPSMSTCTRTKKIPVRQQTWSLSALSIFLVLKSKY